MLDEVDQSLETEENGRSVRQLKIVDLFGEEQLISTLGVIHVVYGNLGVPSLISVLRWPCHRFYNHRFYQYEHP